MHLFVRNTEGNQTYTIEIDNIKDATISDVKSLILQRTGCSLDNQRIIYGLRDLDDDSKLCENNIFDKCTLNLVPVLDGGAKKKKKVYMTPKKTKHSKKKVKLAVLKYYKVMENGEVVRCRRECSSEQCGAGVFMATHFDRYYCGRCALTYMIDTSAKSQ
ncbi:hypothetical protein GJ496_001622 [Pomphorhynchus laevis]|nr:hypothetical protein GJ496_001622 [Pomphorhynchus laevis]